MSAISSYATRDLTVSGLTTGLPASITALVDRVLERLAPEPTEAAADAAADSQWMPRLVTGFIEAVPYTRGAIAMSVDAARGLLDLQARDPRSARRVLEHLGALARSGSIGTTGALSIVDDTLVVVQSSPAGAALVVTHIA